MSKRKVRSKHLALNDHAAADRHAPVTKRKRVDIIKSTNRVPFSDFITQHVPKDNLQYTARSTHEHGHTFGLQIKTVPYSTMPTSATCQIMTAEELDACFDLIHSTSHEAYSQSSFGWHPRRKKREMREAEMRYLLVHSSSQGRKSAEGAEINLPPHASSNPAPKLAGNPPVPPDLRPPTALNPSPNSDKATTTPRSAELSSTLSLTSTRAGKVSLESEQRERLNALQHSSAADDEHVLCASQHDESGRVAANGTTSAVTHAATNCEKKDKEDDVGLVDLGHAGPAPGPPRQYDESHTTCPARDINADSAVIATRNTSQTAPEIIGFASFMLTHAPPEPVIYLYELHLQPAYRALGLGAHLLKTIEDIGRSVGVQRAMLTVFKSNTDARAWYAHKGWEVDSTSPGDVELRRGSRECDYEIRSKVL